MTDELVLVTQSNFIAPAADLQTAMHRYQAVKDFIGKVLNKGVDYGPIPGSDKPTLLKPGAEKMCSFFGLTPKFPLEDKEEDWTGERHGGEPFFYYRYKCQLYRGDQLIAEGEGSCNSWEKKYRYRQAERICPKCGKHTIIKGKEEYGGGWLCHAKRGGCGAKFADKAPEIINQNLDQIKNPDPADIVNTLQKMAQKRALVAPVLIATNTSDYFTQDIEDFIDAPFVDAKVIPPEPPSNPTQDYQDKLREIEANKPVINNEHYPVERPYLPEVVKEKYLELVEKHKDFKPNQAQIGLLVHGMELCFGGEEDIEDKRHTVLLYLTGHASAKELSGKQFNAIVQNWLNMEKDSTGDYQIDPLSVKEAHTIYLASLMQEGQAQLL